MTFTEALSAVFNDSDSITRPIWHSSAQVMLDDGRLCINGFLDDKGGWNNDDQWRAWTITEQDYYADDWEVVDA